MAGIIGITPDPRATGPAHDDFAAAYEAEYGREPAMFCSNACDAVVIVALAIEKAGAQMEPQYGTRYLMWQTRPALRSLISEPH